MTQYRDIFRIGDNYYSTGIITLSNHIFATGTSGQSVAQGSGTPAQSNDSAFGNRVPVALDYIRVPSSLTGVDMELGFNPDLDENIVEYMIDNNGKLIIEVDGDTTATYEMGFANFVAETPSNDRYLVSSITAEQQASINALIQPNANINIRFGSGDFEFVSIEQSLMVSIRTSRKVRTTLNYLDGSREDIYYPDRFDEGTITLRSSHPEDSLSFQKLLKFEGFWFYPGRYINSMASTINLPGMDTNKIYLLKPIGNLRYNTLSANHQSGVYEILLDFIIDTEADSE